MLLRRSCLEQSFACVPVSVANPCAGICYIIIADIGITLVRTQLDNTGVRLASVLFLPFFSKRKHVPVVHTENLVRTDFSAIGLKGSIEVGNSIGKLGIIGSRVPSEVIRVVDSYFFFACALFGRYKNNTERCAGTVNGSRSGIFQYRNVGNVIGVYKRQVIDRHTVDNDKGI